MKRILISPSILSANFLKLGEEVNNVVSAGADMLHIDIMDNHYVPNLSMGPMLLKSLRNWGVCIPFDVHLMAKPIDRLIVDCADSGATYISFHPESTNHIDRSIQLIKDCGCKAGLVFNPSSTFGVLEYVLYKIDLVTLMSVNPGFSGQIFLPMVFNKIRQMRKLIDCNCYDVDLAVDGGVNMDNIHAILKAGANVFIIGTAIFHSSDYQKVLNDFHLRLCK